MKKNRQIAPSFTLLSIIGLVMLLLFSPCKIRQSLQSVFDVPVTEVSNKSITTLDRCSVAENTESTITFSETTWQSTPVVVLNSTLERVKWENIDNKSITSHKKWKEALVSLPYYILYQNFKVYLSLLF